jgi:hypothetical protein
MNDVKELNAFLAGYKANNFWFVLSGFCAVYLL